MKRLIRNEPQEAREEPNENEDDNLAAGARRKSKKGKPKTKIDKLKVIKKALERSVPVTGPSAKELIQAREAER